MNENNKSKGPHQARNKPFPSAGELGGAESAVNDPVMGEAISASDERKTVILDEDLQGLELEDRVWLYWRKNKNFILGTILLAFFIVVGVQAYKHYKASSFNSLASAYEAAATPEALDAFAKQNAGTALAGIAILQNADASYAAKDYAKAAGLYLASQKDLAGNLLQGRARLGQGMSLLLGGKPEDGKAVLNALIADVSAQASFKAEAAYNLGLFEIANGKPQEAKALLEGVVANPANGVWVQLAQEALGRIK